MEFNLKLQELRKRKGLTQDELAKELIVSRTAVSKWESGRGYPNIDSLKAIAKVFDVTVDELLSSEEILFVAQEDTKEKTGQLRAAVFALLDCSLLMFFFLPLFGQTINGNVGEVSLLALIGVQPWLHMIFAASICAMVLIGIFTFICRKCRCLPLLSLAGSVFCSFLFILSRQPYAAVFVFVFFIVKVFLFVKQR